MASDLLGIAASAAGGGIFGLIGTALGRVAGFFEKRQSLAHEKARWDHETVLLQLQRDSRREESEAEQALVDARGSWAGLAASYAAETGIGESYRWVHAVRALTRPGLTLLLWLITGAVFSMAAEAEQARIVEASIFAATAATLWWFGDRSAGKTGGR